MKTNSKGFTVIEVMIVLAVAAVIMVVVLLGVQSLQKSQKTQKNQDAAGKVLAALQDFQNSTGHTPNPLDTGPNGDVTKLNASYFVNIKSASGDAPKAVDNMSNNQAVNTTGNTLNWSTGVRCFDFGGVGILIRDSQTYDTTIGVTYWSESANRSVCKDSQGAQH